MKIKSITAFIVILLAIVWNVLPAFMSWQGSALNVVILVWYVRNLQIAQLVLRAFILLGELVSLAAVDAYHVTVQGIALTAKKTIIWT